MWLLGFFLFFCESAPSADLAGPRIVTGLLGSAGALLCLCRIGCIGQYMRGNVRTYMMIFGDRTKRG